MLDLKITNGRILDGTGAPWFRADIGVRGDTIVSIGDLANEPSKTTIDAQNHIVSPGFIDLLGQDENAVFRDPHLEPKIRQGVTTELTGEGGSPRPSLRDFFEKLQKNGTAVNFALLVGASNPREMVIGNVNRKPTAQEMAEMESIVDQEMRNGAVGLSTSLIYLPAMFSTTDEIINLAKVAAKYGGVYFTHMRDEGDHIDAGLDEAFAIGREAKIPINIWHLKTGGRTNWGRMPHVIERINAARDEGIDVAANVYPYAASATSLSTILPDWSLEGGYSEMQKRLADPEQRARIAEGLRAQVEKRGERGIYVTRIDNPALAQFEKKYVEQIAHDMNLAPDEALMKLFAETNGSPSVIFFSMNEDDVKYALKQPFVSIGSDSGAPSPEQRAKGAAVHPRAYGTAARVAGHYVRDEKLFTLEEAVRKMTSQAADRIRVSDRGILRPGMKADIIVFDEANVRDLASYEQPNQFSQGIIDVVVNGEIVLRDGTMTNALPGRPIRGRGYEQR
ncbi:MAG TPA: D-aminoacylase [Thermoanaerobaculia bacterium]|nr:D-aminoacylase [Thermoanaerobaculia bacterium]